MKNMISLFRVINRVALCGLILIITIIPFLIDINETIAFVVLPTLLVFIFLLSILIEEKLNLLDITKIDNKIKRCCFFTCCLDKNCLL